MNMPRFIPRLGGFVAVIAAIVAANGLSEVYSISPAPRQTASSTISVAPSLQFPSLPFPTLELSADMLSTTGTPDIVPVKAVVPPAKVTDVKSSPAAEPLTTVSAPTSVTTVLPSGNASLDGVVTTLRGALVNILCNAPQGTGLHSTSGSGIFVDSKGIILTNAHIAQYFLLADRNVTCTIRTGAPATERYKAELIYISPAWIHANATILTQAKPSGTGEYDFAFLAVTKSETSAPLPESFPFVPLAQKPPSSGTPVVIATYGAQFLESSQVHSGLYPTVVFGSVKDVFTFARNTVDVIALGGSAAAQEGSSGGGVADASGSLVGTVTTSTISGATDTRSLAAITASYIRAQYAREMGNASLDGLLQEATSVSIADFAKQIPTLESIITAQLR